MMFRCRGITRSVRLMTRLCDWWQDKAMQRGASAHPSLTHAPSFLVPLAISALSLVAFWISVSS